MTTVSPCQHDGTLKVTRARAVPTGTMSTTSAVDNQASLDIVLLNRDVRGKCQHNTATMRGTFQVLRRHGDDIDSTSTMHDAPRKIDIDHYCASMAFVL